MSTHVSSIKEQGAWLDKHFPHGVNSDKRGGEGALPPVSSMEELGINKWQSSQSRLISKEPEF